MSLVRHDAAAPMGSWEIALDTRASRSTIVDLSGLAWMLCILSRLFESYTKDAIPCQATSDSKPASTDDPRVAKWSSSSAPVASARRAFRGLWRVKGFMNDSQGDY